MLGNYITVDGVSSRTLGLFCKQLPMYPVAVRGMNAITVGGRLEDLYQSADHYADFQIDIEAVLIGFDMDPVIRYFSAGKRLVLSNIPDRYAVIRQLVAIDQQRVGNGALELKITLKCSPFKHKIANDPIICTQSPHYFRTSGTIYSEPVIVVTGCSSSFTMELNGTQFSISGLSGDVYVDVPNRVAYQFDDQYNQVVVLDHTAGNIWDLLLVPSDIKYNALTFSGADAVEITPNERWL